jgi:hypothetical protein
MVCSPHLFSINYFASDVLAGAITISGDDIRNGGSGVDKLCDKLWNEEIHKLYNSIDFQIFRMRYSVVNSWLKIDLIF